MPPLQTEIEDIVGEIDGRVGVCVRDLASGAESGVRLDEPLPMASVCKIPILVAAFRKHEAGQLDLAERVAFTEGHRCFGSGLLNAFDPGLKPTIHDLLLLMIVISDNAATDLALARAGGPVGVTEAMRALGRDSIRVDRTIAGLLGDFFSALDPSLAGMKYGEWDARCAAVEGLKERSEDLDAVREAVNRTAGERDTATVRDMARLCAQIARNECAGAASCAAMIDILNKQQLNGRLPKRLPAFTKFPHKTGTLGSGAVVNDVGILYKKGEPVASVAVLSRDNRTLLHDTEHALARLGRAVYDYY